MIALAEPEVESAAEPEAQAPEREQTTPSAVPEPGVTDEEDAEILRLAEYDIETARMVSEAEDEVFELEQRWESKHAAASAAKKEFELAREELRNLIRDRNRKRTDKPEPTLFDNVPASQDVAQCNIPDDLWKTFPLSPERWERFGVSAKDIEKLNAGETKHHGTHPMATLGDVTRFITPDPSNPAYARTLKDVKGFGDAAMDRWTNAETQFWGWWKGGGEAEFAKEQGAIAHEAGDETGPEGGSPGHQDHDREPEPAPQPEDGINLGEHRNLPDGGPVQGKKRNRTK